MNDNKSKWIVYAAAFGALAIVALALVARLTGFRVDSADPRRIQPRPEQVQSTPAPPTSESKPGPSPLPARTPAANAGARRTPMPSVRPASAPATDSLEAGALAYPEQNEASIGEETLLRMIEEKGSVEAAYKLLTPAHREDMIAWLQAEGRLSAELGALLGAEASSDLRAYMLARADFNVEALDEATGQPSAEFERLKSILADTPADANAEEWKERLQASMLFSDEFGIEMARKAKATLEQDPHGNLAYSTSMLQLANASEDIAPAEKADAEKAVYDLLRQTDSQGQPVLSPDERIRGYFSLLLTENQKNAQSFLQERLKEETDPNVIVELERLLKK